MIRKSSGSRTQRTRLTIQSDLKMRSIFIFCLMLQCSNLAYGSENSPDNLLEKSADDSESSSEELTSNLRIEASTESTNPPIILTSTTAAAMTLEEIPVSLASPYLVKYVGVEPTEVPIELLTEAYTAASGGESDQQAEEPIEINVKKPALKSIKARLLETKPEEIELKSKHRDDETFESTFEEDTTPLAEIDAEINETNINIADEETTIQPPTSKKPKKKIEIYKTRPNVLLRHYVEDVHLRSPVAALIDKKSNPLMKAKKLWKAALRPNALLDIMVVSFDSEGIKSTYSLTNTRSMMATMDRVREENITVQESKTYYSIIRTGQLIPYDSAIFLSTDSLPNDTEHQQPASMILLKKRIRLYLVIFDEKNHVVNSNSTTAVRQTGFLGQLALKTGGDVIYVPNHAFRPDGEMGLITLVVGNRLKPIDSELREVYENELKNDNTDIVGEETTSIRH